MPTAGLQETSAVVNMRVASLLGRSMIVRRITSVSLTLALVCATLALPGRSAEAGGRYADIVVDVNTGKVLHSTDPDGLRYPASLTKMMTLYLVFEALEKGRIRLNSPVPVSRHASSEPPSKLGLKPGQTFTVEQGIQALVTRSANDAATAFGEFLGGSEARFAQMMTAKARALGMSRTTYRNANGLPNPGQMTTARDQARLGMALRQHFPQYYAYFSTRSFTYGRQVIGNHNRLVGSVRGVDGIKTGFTNASGFNLVTSLQLEGRSMVGVVLGGVSGAARDNQMRKLMATYLPEASRRGGSSALIARQSSVPEPVAPVAREVATTPQLPSSGVPVPGGRYDNGGLEETAYAGSAPSDDAVQALANQAEPSPAGTLRLPAGRTLANEPAPMPHSRKSASRHPKPPANIDRTVTFSTPEPDAAASGWTVQIGVSADKDAAMDLLKNAKVKSGASLKGARPLAMAYGDGDSKVYRARFVGFKDQKTAVNACNGLKKAGVSCWAAMN